jgi:Protein kinase domain
VVATGDDEPVDEPTSEDERPADATVVDEPVTSDPGLEAEPPTDLISIPELPVKPLALAPAGAAARTGSEVSLTTAIDALRDEEVERTRLFIRFGWAISIATIATVPLLNGSRTIGLALVVALSIGIVVSSIYYRQFADPKRYTERKLLVLAVTCTVNASVAALHYGVFTAVIGLFPVGIHFVARTEAERAARWIFATAIASYVLLAGAVITGAMADPGVYATDRVLPHRDQLVGAAFVLGVYVLAYVSARMFRRASLKAIDDLQRATRRASQREALMDELRADLERALRVGGPGRYSERAVGGFQLGTVLGRGAMGEVYEATNLATGEPAAVKLLRRELLTDPTQVARFVREARASGALDSPHIVKVLDGAADDAALPFIAMELLQGVTLAEVLRAESRLAAFDVLELVRQIGAGLDAAGRAGIVHRDLKPQNLFRVGELETTWKILDFGVATLADSSGTLTQGGIVGTPAYMAPEQAQGKRVDPRADVYALAAVAYRCMTGKHPYTGADTPSMLYAVVHKMPTRPGELVEGLTADLDRWFALALAKAPEDRFQTGAELAWALDAALRVGLDPALRRRADVLIRKLRWD